LGGLAPITGGIKQKKVMVMAVNLAGTSLSLHFLPAIDHLPRGSSNAI